MNQADDIRLWLMRPDSVPLFRLALIQMYCSFCHKTPIDKLHVIRQYGLSPRDDGGYFPPQEVRNVFGLEANKIVCLSPYRPYRTDIPMSVSKPNRCSLSIGREHLPERVSFDWSFTDAWNLLPSKIRDHPGKSVQWIAAYQAGRDDSVLSYDGIPPEHLHVKIKGFPDQPACEWPLLLETLDEEVHVEESGYDYPDDDGTW